MDHSKLYKNVVKSGEELRRRRCDQNVEIRKARKNESLQKRRNMNVSGLSDDELDVSPLKQQSQNLPFSAGQCINDPKEEVRRIVEATDDTELYSVIGNVRKLLSRTQNPPIDAYVKCGVVEAVLPFLSQTHATEVCFEALWVITNVASGASHHTRKVVEMGAVEPLLHILEHASIDLAEQAAWALGNIAGEGEQYRDMLCDKGIVEPLIKTYRRTRKQPKVVGIIAWVMSNLCRNKNPPPKLEVVQALISPLSEILQYNFASEIKVDAMWALAYATETNSEVIDLIIRNNLVHPLVKAIDSPNHTVQSPALRCLGNLVTGTDEQTEHVCNCGLLNHILPVLTHTKPVLVKEAVWLLSNIAAGTPDQIQYIINANLVPTVLKIMKEGDVKSQREAVWVISNMCQTSTDAQLGYLLSLEGYNYFISVMNDAQPKNIMLALETLGVLFKTATKQGCFENVALSFESHDGLEMLEALQEHEHQEIYKAAFELINEYFGDDEEGAESRGQDETNASKMNFEF